MKEIIFIENHKTFNTKRLGLCLAYALQSDGQEVILAGRKGKLPLNTGMRSYEFSSSVRIGTISQTLAEEKPTRVISIVSLAACEAASRANIPYIYVEPENFKEEKTIRNKRTLLNNAQKVVVVGTSKKSLDKKRYGSNAVRVPNPALAVIHDDKYKPTCFKKPNNILAAGKLAKNDSGFDTLLSAWAKLAPIHDSWHLTVWGDGANKTALQNFIKKHNLQDSTEIVDATTDLSSLLCSADIYVHPNTTTDGVDSVLDALASRLPVIATDLPTVRDYVTNDVNGCLVPANAQSAWTKTLDKLMADWGKRVGLALEAEKTTKQYSKEKFVSLFEDKK